MKVCYLDYDVLSFTYFRAPNFNKSNKSWAAVKLPSTRDYDAVREPLSRALVFNFFEFSGVFIYAILFSDFGFNYDVTFKFKVPE